MHYYFHSSYHGLLAQLVRASASYLIMRREREVGGSNPLGPTNHKIEHILICPGGVVRPIISPSRGGDPGSNDIKESKPFVSKVPAGAFI